MSFLNNIMNKIRPEDNDDRYLDDEYFDSEEEPEYRENKKESGKHIGLFSKKVIDGAPQGMQLITMKPTKLEDYMEICDYLLEGRIVVLNLEGLSTSIAQRIIDFTYGGVYAINGNFQSINKYIFIATPMSVDVSGDFVENVLAGNTENSTPRYQGYGNSGSNGFRYND